MTMNVMTASSSNGSSGSSSPTSAGSASSVGAEELARQELQEYQGKMSRFLQSSPSSCPPSALELRQQHALFSMEAIDSYRSRSVGRPILVWKLERELAALFEDILMITSKVRRESFNDSRSTSPSPRRATVAAL